MSWRDACGLGSRFTVDGRYLGQGLPQIAEGRVADS
jgi:hypothetical protein